MKIPKKINRFCRKCKTHTDHSISVAKKRDRSSLKKGSLARRKLRGLERGAGNKGKSSRGALSSWKMYGKKGSKKGDFRYKCEKCGKMSVQRKGFRAKKFEIVAKE